MRFIVDDQSEEKLFYLQGKVIALLKEGYCGYTSAHIVLASAIGLLISYQCASEVPHKRDSQFMSKLSSLVANEIKERKDELK